jgi:serine/threonine protein kinase
VVRRESFDYSVRSGCALIRASSATLWTRLLTRITRGVVHRDIKPENVLLSDRHALVSDFGIAKAIGDMSNPETTTTLDLTTAAGSILGTLTYMAPEQAGGETIDHRADIYSVGILAYEMLTGRLPFSATTARQMIAAHLTKPPDPISTYKPEFSRNWPSR